VIVPHGEMTLPPLKFEPVAVRAMVALVTVPERLAPETAQPEAPVQVIVLVPSVKTRVFAMVDVNDTICALLLAVAHVPWENVNTPPMDTFPLCVSVLAYPVESVNVVQVPVAAQVTLPEFESNVAVSAASGGPEPVEPPDDVDQMLVFELSHVPLPTAK
jgi:hypothetical protein